MEVILDDTQHDSEIEAYEDIPHHTAREPAESIQVTHSFPDMSKKDSRKGLKGVYRRCLSALGPKIVFRMPSLEKCEKMKNRVSREVVDMKFHEAKEAEDWAKSRFKELYREEQLRLLKDVNADLRDRIERMMDQAV